MGLNSAFVRECHALLVSDGKEPPQLPELPDNDPVLLAALQLGVPKEQIVILGLLVADAFCGSARVTCEALALCLHGNPIAGWETQTLLERDEHPLQVAGYVERAECRGERTHAVRLSERGANALRVAAVRSRALHLTRGPELFDLLHEWAHREAYERHPADEFDQALSDWADHPIVARGLTFEGPLGRTLAKVFLASVGKALKSPGFHPLEALLAAVEPRLRARSEAIAALSREDHVAYRSGLLESQRGVMQTVSHVRISATMRRELKLGAAVETVHHHPAMRIVQPDAIHPVALRFPAAHAVRCARLEGVLGPRAFRGYTRKSRKAVGRSAFLGMLYGGPGTGKTEWVRQTARATGRPLVEVQLSELRDMYIGQSERLVADLFRTCAQWSASSAFEPVVLFDEADGFFSTRQGSRNGDHQVETNLKTLFLKELERYEGILFATCNAPEHLDPAFDRRFPIKLHFPRPDASSRFEILRTALPGWRVRELRGLASRLPFSGAEVRNVTMNLLLLQTGKNDFATLERLLQEAIDGWNTSHCTRTQIGYTLPT